MFLRSAPFRFLLACLIALAPSLAFAQSQATTGVIEGTVTRPERRRGARRHRRRSRTPPPTSSARLITDADGRFRGLLLPLGPYRVTVTLKGFATLVREGLDLPSARRSTWPSPSRSRAVQEEIARHGRLRRWSRRPGRRAPTSIDQAAIRGLPNNGRNFLDFTKLTPGVSDRAGARRRRADHQRAEGHPQQRLRGRRRLQQPVLRRAARRPAPGLHLQPRRRQGGRRRGRGAPTPSSAARAAASSTW